MDENICVSRKAFVDLAQMIEEINDKMEALELASDPEFMESLRKSEEEIKKRDFGSWDDL